MEELNRFDIAQYQSNLMVVIESELLPPDPAIVIIPLLRDYPAIRHLNPTILHDGQELILATRLISSVRRTALRRVGSAADQDFEITRAVDMLMAGF